MTHLRTGANNPQDIVDFRDILTDVQDLLNEEPPRFEEAMMLLKARCLDGEFRVNQNATPVADAQRLFAQLRLLGSLGSWSFLPWDNRSRISEGGGVYVLVTATGIAYVGQTAQFRGRLYKHEKGCLGDNGMEFLVGFIGENRAGPRRALEAVLICAFKPPLNHTTAVRQNRETISLIEMLSRLGDSPETCLEELTKALTSRLGPDKVIKRKPKTRYEPKPSLWAMERPSRPGK